MTLVGQYELLVASDSRDAHSQLGMQIYTQLTLLENSSCPLCPHNSSGRSNICPYCSRRVWLWAFQEDQQKQKALQTSRQYIIFSHNVYILYNAYMQQQQKYFHYWRILAQTDHVVPSPFTYMYIYRNRND